MDILVNLNLTSRFNESQEEITRTLAPVALMHFIVMFLFLPASICGNLLILLVMFKEKTLRVKSTNLYIVLIAFVDLALPLLIASRYFGVQPGATRSLLINLAQTVSFNLQLGLAVDRYWAVCHPMSYFTNKDSGYRNMIILACVGYSVFEFTVVVCFEFMQMSKLESAFRTFSTVVFASSIVAIIVLYLLMRESLTKQGQLRRFMSETSNMPTQAQLKQINDEAELAKTMLLIVASCLICWVPPLVLSAFTAELRPRMDTTTDLKDFRFCLFVVKMEWIGFFINATINPMIYAYRMKEVRSSIANLIVCCPKGPVKVTNCDVTKDNKAFKRDNTNNTKSTTFGTSPSSPSIP